MRRVLVTRPEPGGSQTAGKLSVLGFAPVVLPLTRIVPIAPEGWPPVDGFQAVAITSANAVRHAPPALLRQIAHLPAFAVGRRTGEIACEAGLKVVDDGAGDAATLTRRIADGVARGSRVLILCGRVRREILEEGLALAGLRTYAMETYDTLANLPSEPEMAALLGEPVDAVLLFSAFSARMFAQIAEKGPFDRTVCFAISERVMTVLPKGFQQRSYVAPEPTEEAMLSMLARHI